MVWEVNTSGEFLPILLVTTVDNVTPFDSILAVTGEYRKPGAGAAEPMVSLDSLSRA